MMRPGEKQPRWSIPNACVKWIAAGMILCATSAASSTPRAAQGVAPRLTVLQGKLLSTSGDCPVLRIHEKDKPLSANTTYLYRTLQDKRLADREVQLEGTMKADGTFEVQRLYTVKDGKLYRVRYFCKTCNIVALGPGDCVCCQQPTELQEVSVADNNTN